MAAATTRNPHPIWRPGADESPSPLGTDSRHYPSPIRSASPRKKTARSGTSWAFPWAWTHSQVFRGLEELEGARESRPAPVSRPGSRLKSSKSDPKTEAVKAWWPVTTTRQCLVPVRLQRAKTSFPGQGTLRCAPCSFPPGVSKVSSACSARQRQSSRRSDRKSVV